MKYIILFPIFLSFYSFGQSDSLDYYSKIMKDMSVKNVCSGERLIAFNYLVSKIEIGKTKRKFAKKYFGKQYFDKYNFNSFEYSYPINAECTGDCAELEDVVGYTLLFACIEIRKGVIVRTGFKQYG